MFKFSRFFLFLLLDFWDYIVKLPQHINLFFYRLTVPILEGHITVNLDYRLEYVSLEKYPITRVELQEEVAAVYDMIADGFWLEREPTIQYDFCDTYVRVHEPFKILNLVELIELYKLILDSGEEFDAGANSNKVIRGCLKDYVRVAIMDYLDILDKSDKFVLYLFLRQYMDFQSDQVDKEFYEMGMLL